MLQLPYVFLEPVDLFVFLLKLPVERLNCGQRHAFLISRRDALVVVAERKCFTNFLRHRSHLANGLRLDLITPTAG